MTKQNGELSSYDQFLEKIKRELKKGNFTYESFAALFKHGASWIGLKMTGDRELSVRLLFEIAEILNIEPALLLPKAQKNPATLEEFIIKTIEKPVRKIIQEEIEKASRTK